MIADEQVAQPARSLGGRRRLPGSSSNGSTAADVVGHRLVERRASATNRVPPSTTMLDRPSGSSWFTRTSRDASDRPGVGQLPLALRPG